MTNRFAWPCIFLLLCPLLTAQIPAPSADGLAADEKYRAGLAFLEKLKLEPEADAEVFRTGVPARMTEVLTAVVTHGQAPSATTEEWTALHRALDGLIELCIWQDQLFKASVYATLQSSLYHLDEGDDRRSLAAAQQALDLQKRSGLTATLWVPWKGVANALLRLGKIDEAEDAFRQACASIPDAKSDEASSVRLEFIEVLAESGKLSAAETESQRLNALAEGNVSATFRANSLLAESSIEIAQSRFDEALNSLKKMQASVSGDPKASDFSILITARLAAVGSSAMSSLPYPQAKEIAARMEHEFPEQSLFLSGFLRQVLNYRRRLAGEFDDLLREDNQAVESARERRDAPGQAEALLSLGSDLAWLRDWSHAISALDEADTILKNDTGSPMLRFRVKLTLSAAYLERNDIRSANATLRVLLNELEAVHEAAARNRYARIYGQAQLLRARAAVMEDDADTAREILQVALDPKPGQYGKYTRSDVLLQSARTERDLRERPAEAVRLYSLAIEQLHQEKELQQEAFARLTLTRFLLTDGARLPDAQAVAVQQLRFARTGVETVTLTDALWRVSYLEGVLAQSKGEQAAAIASFGRAIVQLEEMRAGLSESALRQSLVDDDSAQDLYRRLESLQTKAGMRDAAWETLERDKARTFLETLRGRRFAQDVAQASPQSEELRQLETQTIALRVQLTPQVSDVLRGAGQPPEVLQTKLHQLQSRIALLRQQAELESNRSTQPLSTRTMSLSAVQRHLHRHQALVEYSVIEGGLTAFIVSPNTAQQVDWPVDTKLLPSELRRLQLGFSSFDPDSAFQARLRSMSELLLRHVVDALPQDTQSLLIVPTGSTAYIPFQALLLPDGKQVLDRFTVTYLPSASTLQFLKPFRRSKTTKPFIGALGNISVDGWAPLPGTLVEAAQISKIYGAANVTEAERFNHDSAVEALRGFDEVHFATHGLVDENAPLFSALLVAPAPGEPERLSLYEVMDLKLKARLVVLSACETNRGKLLAGDEVTGLTRTFLQAGADDVVSSLWKVSDESTALLMRTFHEHLRAGSRPAQALREAELTVRAKYPSPVHWAAFVNTGIE